MKLNRSFALFMGAFLCSLSLAQAQDMDTAISKLTEDVASRISDNGNKKVTVLDFTDLQGNSTELGKYVAEQLTVDFVMNKRSFAVLDRANLKRILDEHQLTAEGLVDPENAKQLGKFAGVDAMIFGTIVPVGSNIKVAVKVITTDSAVIVGGAKAEFKSDDNVQQLLSHSTKSESTASTTEAQKPAPPPPPKLFGDLQARVESVRLVPNPSQYSYGGNGYGFARMILIITNMSDSQTYGVALKSDNYNNKLILTNDRGDTFQTTDLSGIEGVFQSPDGFRGALTDIPPLSSITIVANSQVRWSGRQGEYRPYHLQTEIVFGIEDKGRYQEMKKYNWVTDVK